jgi:alpha-1,3-mannosyltransferase
MAKITAGECSASECSLICNDYWDAGYGRILMVPRVKLAYDSVSGYMSNSLNAGGGS